MPLSGAVDLGGVELEVDSFILLVTRFGRAGYTSTQMEKLYFSSSILSKHTTNGSFSSSVNEFDGGVIERGVDCSVFGDFDAFNGCDLMIVSSCCFED